MFLCWALGLMNAVRLNIRDEVFVHGATKASVVLGVTFATYSIVMTIAWWMILRGKPRLKEWAYAANAILIFNYFPGLIITWDWRSLLKAELEWWPVILIGLFGNVIFSIPYHGWRNKSPILANQAAQ
jgi:hypothetical protein